MAPQGRLAAAGEQALNEKRLIARAGLADVQRVIGDDVEVDAIIRDTRHMLDLPPWR